MVQNMPHAGTAYRIREIINASVDMSFLHNCLMRESTPSDYAASIYSQHAIKSLNYFAVYNTY